MRRGADSTFEILRFQISNPKSPTNSRHQRVKRMLKCSTSLWSADLSSLAAEIRRVEPYSEMFHIDVADGHYVDTLLFFPDLVKACRQHTKKPFEVHLIVTNPLKWIDAFADAGANSIIIYLD